MKDHTGRKYDDLRKKDDLPPEGIWMTSAAYDLVYHCSYHDVIVMLSDGGNSWKIG